MNIDNRHNLNAEAPRVCPARSLARHCACALLTLALSASVLGIQALAQSSDKMVPLPIELPKLRLEGTPENMNVPYLEKPSNKPRDPFLAPAGVVNVAKGKPVTSSEKEPLMGELSMITDGDKTQAMDSVVELGPNLQSVTIDLGGNYEVYAVLFWHSYFMRAYVGIVVQLAEDKAFTKGVQTIFNNDRENKNGLGAGTNNNYVESHQGRLVDAKGAHARYVRLFSRGNSRNNLNHYIEVEVYGRPAKQESQHSGYFNPRGRILF